MPMVSGFTIEGTGRKIGDWLGELEHIKSDDGSEYITTKGLIEKLGVTRAQIRSQFSGLYEADTHIVVAGKSNACFLVKGLNKMGRLFNEMRSKSNNDAVYRETYKG